MLKKNMIVELVTDDLNNLGFAVAHVEGMTVFVSGAVDGERVRARIISVKRTYAIAKTEEIITPAPHRIKSVCTSCACGGCAYNAVDYAHELLIKQGNVRSAFRRAGLADAVVAPVVSVQGMNGTTVTAHYRNKAQYPIAMTSDGRYVIGFFAPKSHRVVEAADCPLQPIVFHDIVETLRSYFEKTSPTVYDEESGQGLLRHIYLRRATVGGEILLTLVVNGHALPDEAGLVSAVRAVHPEVVGILLNVNTEKTNVICGDTYRTLWGRDYIVDTLAGVKLRLAAPAFYQVNHDAAELLYAHATGLARLTGKERVLDLFCGCGSIGLSMAHAAGNVIGVEIVPEAVECAKLNACESGIENVTFYTGDAGDTGRLLDIAFQDGKPDIVVLDPPRKGCTAALLECLSDAGIGRIVYISCNPETLARDARVLLDAGYKMETVTPFDLFPRTGHVECVTAFVREQRTHYMNLNPSPFDMIKSGQKTIELRLYDEKRRNIKAGDTIVFTHLQNGSTQKTIVRKLHRFASFEELYENLPLLRCGYTEEDVASACAADMEEYYSPEMQKKYGVVGIELACLD